MLSQLQTSSCRLCWASLGALGINGINSPTWRSSSFCVVLNFKAKTIIQGEGRDVRVQCHKGEMMVLCTLIKINQNVTTFHLWHCAVAVTQTGSQNCRGVEVGRDSWRSSGPTLGGPLVQPPAQAVPPRASCPGPCLDVFCISSRRVAPQPSSATCASARSPSE